MEPSIFFLVPYSEETSFLTTFYGLYFGHHYTRIAHYCYDTLVVELQLPQSQLLQLSQLPLPQLQLQLPQLPQQ